jgi:hypothetical protein
MVHIVAWRNFKRMQATACLFASLIFLAAVVHGWRVLPGPASTKLIFTLGFPAFYLAMSLAAPLSIRPIRRWLRGHMWRSFLTGFGQTPISVLTVLGLLAGAALLIYWQLYKVGDGGQYPAGLFSAYGAGIGLLFAQAIIVLGLERDPKVRPFIEQP